MRAAVDYEVAGASMIVSTASAEKPSPSIARIVTSVTVFRVPLGNSEVSVGVWAGHCVCVAFRRIDCVGERSVPATEVLRD